MKRACLLIHGFLTDYHDFDRLLPYLKNYDRVLNVVIPGHGPLPNYIEFDKKHTIKTIDNSFSLLKKEYEEVDIIGFSMGGALATYLASKENVHRLVLISPANAFINLKQVLARFNLYAKYFKTLITKNKNSKNHYIQALKIVKDDDAHSFQIALKRLFPNYNYHTLSNFYQIIKYCNYKLKRSDVPTLILWGSIDQLVPYRSIKKIKTYFHNSKIEVIEGLSHLMIGSKNSRIICKKIDQFLSCSNEKIETILDKAR